MERWWEQYEIDPEEATATVEAALVAANLSREWVDGIGRVLLDFLANEWGPSIKNMRPDVQAASMRVITKTLRQWADGLDEAADASEGDTE